MTFQKVAEAEFLRGEHDMLNFWKERQIFSQLREQNSSGEPWSFLDGPITANNPMGVHHAWGRTYKDSFQRFRAMQGYRLRYQNGFDCQGLWVEVEVQKELGLATKDDVERFGIDRFVNACKERVLKFAARQTEQSVRLGYWMDWDDPDELRKLSEHMDDQANLTYQTASGENVTDAPHRIVEKLGNNKWGGSYFTFSTENNESIWTFLKKCHERGKIARGHDVMPWSGLAGSAYSQMEVADGRKLTTHRSVFLRFPLIDGDNEYLLVWTTTPWTLTSNVAAAVNPDLDYVKLQANRDGATYYFAQDNLDAARLDREFKEGFGRPEWTWPEGVPKLKTLSQIFKEQGGYEIVGTIKGAEMVGWTYRGPFDDLPAQQVRGGVPENPSLHSNSIECHRVIDGGRDNKGNANVTTGEGTGIVHIATGCGDIDHKLGIEHNLVSIAPLAEDGRFIEGFGEFTGRQATDPEVPKRVVELLKERGFHVADEVYPHVYPFCWRTGDELVFRLVDEWFVDMSWREEIKDVVRAIQWLPPNMQGEERELEWLTNMRDWMISKKRFWGLALPIWVDEETGDFEVIGSLAELKERAVSGWEHLDGQTPHRPWIDRVTIRNPKTGNEMTRIPDVGNPWLDAGIVPFSTLGYNQNREQWAQWYPADLVLECFPGQFRNWFYSLLAMSTMMRFDETDAPEEKRPFKTLFGHRLVMNEEGQPMHKSDGTAIWFEEAAEQLGVDTLRWLYLAQNPSSDLRFGTRHKNEHVALQTVDGTISETREGIATCKVTSKPADEVRRRVLIPLWNSYAFFVNYARLDGFDPESPSVRISERPEIDQWILSNLQSLIAESTEAWSQFSPQDACIAAEHFIDDLSNWYIRRNRRRFWRGQSEGDTDKLAAYQTLYEVLVTLTKLLAPAIPFLSERIYQNLVRSWNQSAPESVHLCRFPEADPSIINEDLAKRTTVAQQIVAMGHKLRESASLRVRQPLAEMRFVAPPDVADGVLLLKDVIREELNLKELSRADDLDDLVSYTFKPNLKTLGPKYGKLLAGIRKDLPNWGDTVLSPLRKGESVSVTVNGESVELQPEDVMVGTEQSADWITAADGAIQVALSTHLTNELIQEGLARDFIRQIQQMRKDAGLEIEDRIRLRLVANGEVRSALDAFTTTIQSETLAEEMSFANELTEAKQFTLGDQIVQVTLAKS